MLAKFEVFIRSKFYWSLSFLPFRVSDGHFLFDFSNFCHLLYKLLFYTSPDSCVASDINPSFYFPCQLHPGWDFAPSCFCSQTLCRLSTAFFTQSTTCRGLEGRKAPAVKLWTDSSLSKSTCSQYQNVKNKLPSLVSEAGSARCQRRKRSQE